MKRSWEGVVLKVMGAKDFSLEVTGREQITPNFLRLHLSDGGMLAATKIHPTMWIRLWFTDAGRPHQRAYTLVDPDPVAGTFSIDFAMHDGAAANWARTVQAGDTIEATVQGSSFEPPAAAPRRLWVVGDPASVPAINSLLDAVAASEDSPPATLWLEHQHDGDTALALHTRPGDAVVWLPRERGGAHLVETVCAALAPGAVDIERDWFWIACEAAGTRAITKHLRRTLGVDKRRISALGYWRA
ncbi:siderophore-interacting protein [Arthrobacter sp. 35W]|uniref:siderophore-interacting protein n=1 Tax=Arthrobacter sp. 35W TaxID=1132441 RepID=UPI00042024FD|nr:siderophore-interacting protein [Arthrobacter sp. 35W]